MRAPRPSRFSAPAANPQAASAAAKTHVSAFGSDKVECAGKEASLLECKQHALDALKPMCSLEGSQQLECEGGELLEEASECSAAVQPMLLKVQPPPASLGAAGVSASGVSATPVALAVMALAIVGAAVARQLARRSAPAAVPTARTAFDMI
jgi:hypothetical protein